MIIEKHNVGAQLVLRAFREKCDFGGSTCFSNVGNSDVSRHAPTLPSCMHLPAYWANKCPDIVLLKGWPQSKADCGKFPAARKRGAITVIPIEYKTCDDFRISETIQQNVYDKYSPNDESPHPHPPNLLTELRAQGWRALGYNPRDKTVGW